MAGLRNVERRFTLGDVALRGNAETRTIAGYAAKFGKLSQNLGGFVERIDTRFFNKSSGDGWPNVLARYNHQDEKLLGTTRAGTLRLSVDDTGLVYEVDTPLSREDVYELVQRGDVAQSSFAFRLPADGDEWARSEDGYPVRTLLTGQLIDVAPVNSPAYLDTSVGLSSLAQRVGADPEEVRAAAAAGELGKFLPPVAGLIIDLASRASADYSLEDGDTPAPSVEHPEHEVGPKETEPRDTVPEDVPEVKDESYTEDSGSERQLYKHRMTLRRIELEALRRDL